MSAPGHLCYFAYGSNMSSQRLSRRVPSAVALAAAELPAHSLCFRKAGRDGSAKCDIALDDDATSSVWGVLYRIDPAHKAELDAAEDLGRGYAVKQVEVCIDKGNWTRAFTYYALQIDDDLQPFSWYLEHVLRGAHEHALPDHYLSMIQSVTSVSDTDRVRHRAELALYR